VKARTRVSAEAAPEDKRDAKELSGDENADLCQGCVKCCTYITVEIDPPRAAWEYDQWIWALHHRGIQIYVEFPEAWYVHFETVCDKLNEAGRCSIYGRHPVLCREYDPRTCERRVPLTEVRAWFDHGEELENWLRERRPAHYRRLMEFRRDMPSGPPIADARRDRTAAHSLIAIGSSFPRGGQASVAAPRPASKARPRRV
jgi:Fe-S-cluster containining protein